MYYVMSERGDPFSLVPWKFIEDHLVMMDPVSGKW